MLKRDFREETIFGIEVIRRFRSFAWWLLLMSLLEMVGPWIAPIVRPAGQRGPKGNQLRARPSRPADRRLTLLLFLLARLLERARAIDEEMREIV